MTRAWSGDREYSEPMEAHDLLVKVPLTTIADLAENVVGRIAGRVMPDREVGVLRAPVTGRSCVIYLAHVEVVYGTHRRQYGERHGVSFVVVEAGHRAILQPEHARLRLRYEQVATRIGAASMTPEERALIQRLQVPPDPVHAGAYGVPPYYTFQEARLEPGMLAIACGAGIREADPQFVEPGGMYRGGDQQHTRIRIAGSRTNPIAISNDDALLESRR